MAETANLINTLCHLSFIRVVDFSEKTESKLLPGNFFGKITKPNAYQFLFFAWRLKFLSDGLESTAEIDYDDKSFGKSRSNKEAPNIIEIEYDGNPNDLIVNFEELENDPNRYQMVIGNYKHLLVQHSDESSMDEGGNSLVNIGNTQRLFTQFTNYKTKYATHKRTRISSSNRK